LPALRSVAGALDWAERLAVAGLFAGLVAAKAGAGEIDAFFWLYLLSEGLVVVFMMTRRPADRLSPAPRDWLLAAAATVLPLFASSAPPALAAPLPLPAAPFEAGLALYLFGAVWQIWAKLTLRRSFGVIAANRGVKSAGPYRFMRHPMYCGYFATQLAILLVAPLAWNGVLYGATWLAQGLRLMGEERLLKEDPSYRAYAARTRFRLIPGLF
jgi:protein-S-isoprenylcysteine O-methyltransferase Ste14